MNIDLLNKEVETNGLNATSQKYKLKKNKIKKLLHENTTKRNIIDNNMPSNIKSNNITKDITKHNLNIEKLKKLIDNADTILRIVEKEKLKKIKVTDNRSTVTTLRINEQIYKLVKKYSKDANETITNIVNIALIEYLERKQLK